MHPGIWSQTAPDKPAIVMAASGRSLTYRDLDRRSMQVARLLRASGLGIADHIAFIMDNRPEVLEISWGAQRIGLYYTPVNVRLTAGEAAYIVDDCGARVMFTSAAVGDLGTVLAERAATVERRLAVGGELAGHQEYEAALAAESGEHLPDQVDGRPMFYTSGSTGRPKGIVRPIRGKPVGTDDPRSAVGDQLQGFEHDTVSLVLGPLYHSGSLITAMTTHRVGGTVVLMERFDAEAVLATIERYRITRVNFVPTMMWRLLNLPPEIRRRHDLSTLRYVMHSGAACSPEIKRGMIEWLGPIVNELYAASEGFGRTFITSPEWLARPGSVGRAVACEIHIAGESGELLPAGEDGTIWFSGPGTKDVGYHNDPVKTASAFNALGWATVGDLGRLDADGYLYLADRRANLIISGGVNIYPQETENVLLTHPAVDDAAVIGVPSAEWGEEVKAVVQLRDPRRAGVELERELIRHCRDRIAHFKCPRSVDFDPALPREPDGKLRKHLLRDRYRAAGWEQPG